MTHPAVLLLLAVSAVPTLAGLAAALWVGLDSAGLQRVLATPGIGLSMATSVWTGLLATGIALLLAHFAVALAVSGGWRRRLNNAVMPLLALPHLAVGISLALLLAPSGLLLRLLSPWPSGFSLPPDWLSVQDPFGISLILGLAIKETCFLVLVLFAALAQVPASRLQAQGRTLGYGRLKTWLVLVAPLLQRQIRLPLAAVLVFGITNVELAIPLGPDLPPTFAVMLWRWFTDPDPLIHAQAYAGTLLLLLLALGCAGLAALAARAAALLLARVSQSGRRRRREGGVRIAGAAVLAALWLTGMLSLAAILLRSAAGPWRFPAVLPAGSALEGWQALLPSVAGVAPLTLLLALATAAAGVALVLPAAETLRDNSGARRRTGFWLFLPLLLPQMTFLFGVQVLFAGLRIDGTFVAVLWSHLVFALPYLWGLLAPARAAIDPRYLAVARTLGATPARAWLTTTAPLLTRATLLAFALAFSVSIALYLPTQFAGAGRIATAATEAAAAAGAGSLRLASVHAILLAVAPLVAFALAYGIGAILFRHRREVPR